MTGYGGRDRYQDDRRSYDRGTFIFFYRFYSILLIFTQTHFQTTVVIIVVMVSVEVATITIVTAAAVPTTTIAMTAIEDQALIGMIAMIAEAIGIEAMEVTEIAAMEVTEIITEITEMTVEVTKGVHQFGILAMMP